jgi:hypothetical protein
LNIDGKVKLKAIYNYMTIVFSTHKSWPSALVGFRIRDIDTVTKLILTGIYMHVLCVGSGLAMG